MSERIAKVESVVRQTVAAALPEVMGETVAALTVTAVDVSPNLRTAIVWIGSLSEDPNLLQELEAARPDLQRQLGKTLTTKFVPRLEFKLDQGGRYAEHINRLLKQ